jgi:hypothetical protein
MRRRARPASAARQVVVPLPPALRKHHGLAGGVALVDVEGGRLKLRFLRPSTAVQGHSTLTAPEEAVLARGGVAAVADDEMRVVEGRTAAEYEHLRATSLSAEEAARRLGVNPSRVRQRLAERSLYGIKEGKAWLLPAFQFRKEGEVPGLDTVVRRLPPDIGALAVARWFASPNPDLCTRDEEERPLTPLQWLLAGNLPGPAAELAAAL